MKVKSLSHVRLSEPHGLQPTRLLCPWDFPGKSTGVGCHCLLHMRYEIPRYEIPRIVKFTETERMVVSKDWQVEQMGSDCLIDGEFGKKEKFWRWMMVMVLQQWKCT